MATTKITKTKQAKIDALRAEREQINNQLSGLRTRLKRAEKGDRTDGIQARVDQHVARRAEIGDELTRLEPAPATKTTADTTSEPEADTAGDAA